MTRRTEPPKKVDPGPLASAGIAVIDVFVFDVKRNRADTAYAARAAIGASSPSAPSWEACWYWIWSSLTDEPEPFPDLDRAATLAGARLISGALRALGEDEVKGLR